MALYVFTNILIDSCSTIDLRCKYQLAAKKKWSMIDEGMDRILGKRVKGGGGRGGLAGKGKKGQPETKPWS